MAIINKQLKREKRSVKTRSKIRSREINRLTVFRSNQHIYAQVTSFDGSKVLVSASSLESDIRSDKTGDKGAAEKVGKLVAQRAIEQGITEIAFDRSGYKFHGRIKALAEAAREQGLKF
jgi:large subunit ribosomal protein L18|tara:strand:+ start:738 stop:1094 length:357 start_codon:yes stop_codon:yes gene_type:complete